jgi:NTE family protein
MRFSLMEGPTHAANSVIGPRRGVTTGSVYAQVMDTSMTVAPRLAALRRPLALCLSGGGARGAAQAGAVMELVAQGLRPDLIVGTSIGAWNGSWLAAHPDVENARALQYWWTDPEVRRVMRGMLLGYAGALAWRRSAALSADRVERLLGRALGTITFEELQIPLAVGAVDLLSGDLMYFDRGPVAEAVRASSAIPTVLPPVALDDRLFLDGGVIDNFGVNEAVRRGARTIILVDASTSELSRVPIGLGAIVDRATLVAQLHQRRRSLAAAAAAGVPIHLVEMGSLGGVLDFTRLGASLELGRQAARAWLAGEPLPSPAPLGAEERRRAVASWRVVEDRVLPLWRRATGQQARRNGNGATAPGSGIILPAPGMAEASGG